MACVTPYDIIQMDLQLALEIINTFCINSCLFVVKHSSNLLLFVKKILVNIQMHHILFQFHCVSSCSIIWCFREEKLPINSFNAIHDSVYFY